MDRISGMFGGFKQKSPLDDSLPSQDNTTVEPFTDVREFQASLSSPRMSALPYNVNNANYQQQQDRSSSNYATNSLIIDVEASPSPIAIDTREDLFPPRQKVPGSNAAPVRAGLVGNIRNFVGGLFQRNQQQQSPQPNTAQTTGVYIPSEAAVVGQGIFGSVARLVRRRVLNLWDGSPRWAKAAANTRDSRMTSRNNADIFVTNRAILNRASQSTQAVSSNRRRSKGVVGTVISYIPIIGKRLYPKDNDENSENSNRLRLFSNTRLGNNNVNQQQQRTTRNPQQKYQPPQQERGITWIRSTASKAVTSIFNFDSILYYWQYFSSGDVTTSPSMFASRGDIDQFTAAQSPSSMVKLDSTLKQQQRQKPGNINPFDMIKEKLTSFQNNIRQQQQPNTPQNDDYEANENDPEALTESIKSLAQAGNELASDLRTGVSLSLKKFATKVSGKEFVWPWEQHPLPLYEEDDDEADNADNINTSNVFAVEQESQASISQYNDQLDDSSMPIPVTVVSPQSSSPLARILPFTSFVMEQTRSLLFGPPQPTILTTSEGSSSGEEELQVVLEQQPDRNFLLKLFYSLPVVHFFFDSASSANTQRSTQGAVMTARQQPLNQARTDVLYETVVTAVTGTSREQQYKTDGILRDIDDLKHNRPLQRRTMFNNPLTNSDTVYIMDSNFTQNMQESTLSQTQQQAESSASSNIITFGRQFIPENSESYINSATSAAMNAWGGFTSSFPSGGSASSAGVLDSALSSAEAQEAGKAPSLHYDRTTELRQKPSSIDIIPLPSKADFSFLAYRRVEIAVRAALNVKSERDAVEYLKDIGLDPLVAAVLGKVPYAERIDKVDAIKGLCRLTRVYKPLADEVGQMSQIIEILVEMMEAPLRGFRNNFRSQVDKDRELRAQHEAISLVQRLVRSSDKAVEAMRPNNRLRKVLSSIMQNDPIPASQLNSMLRPSKTLNGTTVLVESVQRSYEDTKAAKSNQVVRKKNSTTIVEYVNLRPAQMARVASWGLGGVAWKPRQAGQKGLRILSLDGGGTRGVLTIAYLKEILARVGRDDVVPSDYFDIICGTSTGGIIAMLLGAQRRSIDETETLYDDFIGKIFSTKSNLKLVTEQAAYDETELEKILYKMCGESLLLDSNQHDCSRVFCLSTQVNSYPPGTKVWRNYNYPPGQQSRYPGTFRVNTMTAVRATTAAPTFFTPVQWEGGLYCDGALVANNPTAIALQEAKVCYHYACFLLLCLTNVVSGVVSRCACRTRCIDRYWLLCRPKTESSVNGMGHAGQSIDCFNDRYGRCACSTQ